MSNKEIKLKIKSVELFEWLTDKSLEKNATYSLSAVDYIFVKNNKLYTYNDILLREIKVGKVFKRQTLRKGIYKYEKLSKENKESYAIAVLTPYKPAKYEPKLHHFEETLKIALKYKTTKKYKNIKILCIPDKIKFSEKFSTFLYKIFKISIRAFNISIFLENIFIKNTTWIPTFIPIKKEDKIFIFTELKSNATLYLSGKYMNGE